MMWRECFTKSVKWREKDTYENVQLSEDQLNVHSNCVALNGDEIAQTK